MTVSDNRFTLYLSGEGDSVAIKSYQDEKSTLPEQAEALACKTHEEVLAFLKKLIESDTKNHLNFYHHHNTCYDGHAGTFPKGSAHPCSLEKQIDFVQYKISEATHGIRHAPKKVCHIL